MGTLVDDHIAPRRIKTAGEGIEQGDRPARLGGVGVLIDARPRERGHRAGGEEEVGGVTHLVSGHPGNRFNDVWRVALAEAA